MRGIANPRQRHVPLDVTSYWRGIETSSLRCSSLNCPSRPNNDNSVCRARSSNDIWSGISRMDVTIQICHKNLHKSDWSINGEHKGVWFINNVFKILLLLASLKMFFKCTNSFNTLKKMSTKSGHLKKFQYFYFLKVS